MISICNLGTNRRWLQQRPRHLSLRRSCPHISSQRGPLPPGGKPTNSTESGGPSCVWLPVILHHSCAEKTEHAQPFVMPSSCRNLSERLYSGSKNAMGLHLNCAMHTTPGQHQGLQKLFEVLAPRCRLSEQRMGEGLQQ